ncbi:MAG: hypothetical protein GY793_07340 [Proteobacteria bacterium]|nr:hypothetical protein [Pseudomonadota bacterium]
MIKTIDGIEVIFSSGTVKLSKAGLKAAIRRFNKTCEFNFAEVNGRLVHALKAGRTTIFLPLSMGMGNGTAGFQFSTDIANDASDLKKIAA